MKLEDLFIKRLEDRENTGILRELKINDSNIDFYSNDYLSLSGLKIQTSDTSSPGSSRLIAGNTKYHEELEKTLADFFFSQDALLFNSGYSANLGVLSAIPQKNDVILFDELSHASIKDGIRLSLAKGIKFKHNNLEDLERLLKSHSDQRVFVVTEGLFSMDGVYGKIKNINAICKKYSAYLIVDEAHSGGTFGKEGKGLCYDLGIEPFIRIFTLGKAFGGHGAIVTCSPLCKRFLINFSRSFIYTTALPIPFIQRMLGILNLSIITQRVSKLHSNIAYFRKTFSDFDLVSDHRSSIQIYRPTNEKSLPIIEKSCKSNNIGIKAIYPPTVPHGKGCLRICLHAGNTAEEIDKLHGIISQQLL